METDISMYCEKVIYPIEQKKNEIRSIVLKKRFFATGEEKEILEKYEKLVLETYIFLEKLLEEQYKQEAT